VDEHRACRLALSSRLLLSKSSDAGEFARQPRATQQWRGSVANDHRAEGDLERPDLRARLDAPEEHGKEVAPAPGSNSRVVADNDDIGSTARRVAQR
jgi:hypothetical protein